MQRHKPTVNAKYAATADGNKEKYDNNNYKKKI